MAEPKFLLDEHIPAAVAAQLRRRGVDVITIAEARLRGAADAAILAHAFAESRVVVTHDSDFLRLHQQGTRHAGIVFAAQGSRTVGQVVSGLILIHDLLESDDLVGRIEFI